MPARPMFAVLALTLAGPGAAAGTIYVDAARLTGAADGSSWADAFRGRLGLAAALAAARAGDEVWVADGEYAPAGPGSREAGFIVADGVRVLGGFAGDETDESQRSPALHVATLTGDLAGNDAVEPLRLDNAAHIVRMTAVSSATVLDGFTITAGSATTRDARFPVQIERGGGVLIEGGSPRIRGCVFTGNDAGEAGGAVFVDSGSPTIEDCVFLANTGPTYGGGVAAFSPSSPLVARCRFEGNSATFGGGVFSGRRFASPPAEPGTIVVEDCLFIANGIEQLTSAGGGMCDAGARPVVRRCRFERNTASGGAGVFFTEESDAVVDRCTFFDNAAGGDLGDAWTIAGARARFTNCLVWGHIVRPDRFSAASPVVVWLGRADAINCTFASNGDERGGGVFVVQEGTVRASNCIVWNNLSFAGPGEPALQTTIIASDLRFDDCLIEGWTGSLPGDRTFALDPLFTSLAGPDGVPATLDDDFTLAPGSPGIDSGHGPALPPGLDLDIAGLPRFRDDPQTPDTGAGPPVDRGAHEFQPDCRADLTGDGLVDFSDYLEFLNLYDSADPRADFNDDGLIDFADYLEFLNRYDAGC